jgi:hypothetical protein
MLDELTAIVRKRTGVRWVLMSCERLNKENMRFSHKQ